MIGGSGGDTALMIEDIIIIIIIMSLKSVSASKDVIGDLTCRLLCK